MKWAVLATAILMTVLSIAPLTQFEVVKATSPLADPTIDIASPISYPGKIYQETSVPIEVRVFPRRSNRDFVDIYYSLDGGSNVTLGITTYETSSGIFGIGTLDNLTDGNYTMKAYSTDTQGNTISTSTTFQVCITSPASPEPTLTPNNETPSSNQRVILGVAITVAVIGAGLGLLLYLIKRK